MRNIIYYNMDDSLFSEIINNNKQEELVFIENIKNDIKKNKIDDFTNYYDNICYNIDDNDKNNLEKTKNERNIKYNKNETYTTENLVEIQEDICCICGIKETLHYNKRHKFFKATYEYKCVNCGKYFFEHNMVKKPCFSPLKRL